MEKETEIKEVVNETEVYVVEKKHPIRDFMSNHPTITTILVGILAGLGGYAVGSIVGGDDGDYYEDLDDPDAKFSEIAENEVTTEA